MALENCPQCGKELTILQSSGRQICRSCGWIDKPRNIAAASPSVIAESFPPHVAGSAKVIPVEIEVVGSQFKKSVGWTAAGVAAGALIAGPIGAMIGLATQGNGQKFHYIIKFSDETQKVVMCDANKLQLDLILWSWRINNKKTEKDYVTFGMGFSKLQRGMLIQASEIKRLLGLADKHTSSFGEAWQMAELEQQLTKFLKSEIQRYFQEQRNDFVWLEETTGGGFKIPSKTSKSEVVNGIIGLVVLIGIFGGCVANITSTSPVSESRPEVNSGSPEYTRSVIERSGVGETIDSVQEVVDACMVMTQDKGMTYSQAYDYCN